MANPKWDHGTVDEKLELIRKDVLMISDAHNLLSQDHVALQGKVRQLTDELEQLRRKIEAE
jgi:hypothetical protein